MKSLCFTQGDQTFIYIGQTQGHFGQSIFATPQTPVKLNRKGAGLPSNLGAGLAQAV
jgi:hypothetical protein